MTTKKTASKAKMASKKQPEKKSKIKSIQTPYSKTQLVNHISESTDLSKAQVKAVLESLHDLIEAHINKKAVQQMNFLSLFKLVVIKKPATKARKGVNPFTGEEMMFSAKPARNVVKVRPLKQLKEMAK